MHLAARRGIKQSYCRWDKSVLKTFAPAGHGAEQVLATTFLVCHDFVEGMTHIIHYCLHLFLCASLAPYGTSE